MMVVNTLINIIDTKAYWYECYIKFLIPLFSCLFQTIQKLYQLTHLILLIFYYKFIRLCHIDFLFQLSIKESCLNVHLMDEKTMWDRQWDENINYGQSNNRWISIKEIFTFFLNITLSHKSCLVLVNSTIWPKFLFKHPLTTHEFINHMVDQPTPKFHWRELSSSHYGSLLSNHPHQEMQMPQQWLWAGFRWTIHTHVVRPSPHLTMPYPMRRGKRARVCFPLSHLLHTLISI
jgi:hypothetical protein